MENERAIDRFDKYMAHKGLNDNQVTIQLSFSVGLLGKSRKEGRDLSRQATEKITSYYSDLSKSWLLTGEGHMIRHGFTAVPTHFGLDQLINSINEHNKLIISCNERIDKLLNILEEQFDK